MEKKEKLYFLQKLLNEVYARKTIDFSGMGIILYEDINKLPTAPLRKKSMMKPVVSNFEEIIDYLSVISNKSNKFHDGFHLISSDLQLSHICQYFSPPIVKDTNLNYEFGGRYRAGLYGSILETVIGCGVVSNNYEPTIFINGEPIKLSK